MKSGRIRENRPFRACYPTVGIVLCAIGAAAPAQAQTVPSVPAFNLGGLDTFLGSGALRLAPTAAAAGTIGLSGNNSTISIFPRSTPGASAATPYTTLNFGTTGTFLTGFRGNTIVGNYVVGGGTGGLLYDTRSAQWSAMPVATANGVNYPGAISSSPYGPSFGNQGGVLRTVGSYITSASSPYDLSYLYDAAAAPNRQITPLAYPSAPGNPTLYTIAHSTFGDQVVGNYDTRLATGNAMVYTISTGTYVTNNKPGAVSTTAYGIYGDMIAGGYANVGPGGGIGFEHGYLYNKTTGTWATYDHPGAIITHLEGITGAGRSGEYNMVADWVTADGVVHAGVLHVDALGIPTWHEITIPGASLVSSNSAYGDQVVGIYLTPGSTVPNGYVATIAGIYNPIRNTGTLVSGATNAAALSGRKGDDIVNSGTVQVTGNGGIGMRGETYGVLTNKGTVTATGAVGAAVEMHGLYGTLLNYGILQAPAVADALRTGPDSYGTVIVNAGIIDGRIAATAGPQKRFENSGWIGVTGTGIPITHLISGTYVQTAAGTLSLRVGASGNDALAVTGVARLAGTLAVPFQTSTLLNSYDLFAATGGMTGSFTTLATSGLPSFVSAALAYSGTTVTLNLTSQIAQQAGLSSNQAAVGGTADAAFNSGATAAAGSAASTPLGGLYGLTEAEIGAALTALSGEIHASAKSALIEESWLLRAAANDRLRSAFGAVGAQPMTTMSYGFSSDLAPSATGPMPTLNPGRFAAWGQGYGSWGRTEGDGNAAKLTRSTGGLLVGADVGVFDTLRVGLLAGYSHSEFDTKGRFSSGESDNYHLGLYGGGQWGAFGLRTGASYTWHELSTRRTVAFAGFGDSPTSDYQTGTAQVFGELGYRIDLGRVAFEPFAGLAYVNLRTDGLREAGGAAVLSGRSDDTGVGYSTLGLRAATSFAVQGMDLTLRGALGWRHAFGDVDPTATLAFAGGNAFVVAGVPIAKNAALVEAGLDLAISKAATLGVSYTGQLASDAQDHAFKANLVYRF